MKAIQAGLAGILTLITLFGVGILYAQEHSAGQHEQHAMHAMDRSKMDPPGTVFCPGMSTGQLCPTGTVNTLKLDGAKKQSWTEAMKQYNKAVDAATKKLLEDAKPALSPEEYAQVEKWFATGLNPEINRLLAAKKVAAK